MIPPVEHELPLQPAVLQPDEGKQVPPDTPGFVHIPAIDPLGTHDDVPLVPAATQVPLAQLGLPPAKLHSQDVPPPVAAHIPAIDPLGTHDDVPLVPAATQVFPLAQLGLPPPKLHAQGVPPVQLQVPLALLQVWPLLHFIPLQASSEQVTVVIGLTLILLLQLPHWQLEPQVRLPVVVAPPATVVVQVSVFPGVQPSPVQDPQIASPPIAVQLCVPQFPQDRFV